MVGDKVSVDMGVVHLEWQEIPLSREEDTLSLPISKGEMKNPVAVNVGNPHAVFFVENVEKVDLEAVGPEIEHHPLFPERINVEVAEVLSPSKIRMRVWERGVGITQACGTGACAAAVAGVRRGITERKVTVVLDGGTLDIEWCESDGHVLMTGDATEVYRGEVEV
ncbi:MAG: diaminopimelate epimerase [Pseudomonadota bacterium]